MSTKQQNTLDLARAWWKSAGSPMERSMFAASMRPFPKMRISAISHKHEGMLAKIIAVIAKHDFGIALI